MYNLLLKLLTYYSSHMPVSYRICQLLPTLLLKQCLLPSSIVEVHISSFVNMLVIFVHPLPCCFQHHCHLFSHIHTCIYVYCLTSTFCAIFLVTTSVFFQIYSLPVQVKPKLFILQHNAIKSPLRTITL